MYAQAPKTLFPRRQVPRHGVNLLLRQLVAEWRHFRFVVVRQRIDNDGADRLVVLALEIVGEGLAPLVVVTPAEGLAGDSKVLVVDLYAISHDQITNPAPYGLTVTDKPACATNSLGGSSLVCTVKTLAAADVSRYMFADDRHPTPYEYRLIAQYVAEQMIIKGWL